MNSWTHSYTIFFCKNVTILWWLSIIIESILSYLIYNFIYCCTLYSVQAKTEAPILVVLQFWSIANWYGTLWWSPAFSSLRLSASRSLSSCDLTHRLIIPATTLNLQMWVTMRHHRLHSYHSVQVGQERTSWQTLQTECPHRNHAVSRRSTLDRVGRLSLCLLCWFFLWA